MNSKGFTFIEVMVAISVTIVGIVGIYTLVPRVFSVVSTSKDKFISSQLAQEGIELIRNVRDSNWLAGKSWDNSLTGYEAGCEIDYNDSSPVSYQNRYLQIDSNGFYNYGQGANTKFKRKITISPESNLLAVEVEIIWQGKYSPLRVRETLYNWR